MLILSSEMPGECVLDSIQLLSGSDVYNHGVFLNARVYACHTSVAELDSAYVDNYAGNTPEAVMSLDTLYLRWQNGEWQGLRFDSSFDYNGTDNLILEFRWQGDNDSSVYNLGWYTSGNRAVDAKSSTAESGTPRNYMPRFRIFYSATGITEEPRAAGSPCALATPNPFRSSVAVVLTGGRATEAVVYTATGRLVKKLAACSPGALSWDGRDEDGRRVQAGAYFCRARSGSRIQTIQLILHD